MKTIINGIVSIEIGILVIANLTSKGYIGWALFVGILNFLAIYVLLELFGGAR